MFSVMYSVTIYLGSLSVICSYLEMLYSLQFEPFTEAFDYFFDSQCSGYCLLPLSM